MKSFFSISITSLLVFAYLGTQTIQPLSKEAHVKQILTSNPWKQVAFNVSPAIIVDEEFGYSVEDLYSMQDEEIQNQIIKFDAEGSYKIGSGESALNDDILFASRKVAPKDGEKEETADLYEGEEFPTVNIFETGSWEMRGKNQLVLTADNGRMKEEVLTLKYTEYNKIIISFTQIIKGEEHTFTQILESQPFIDLGW
jgi:hypothetical protein